mmetsp:Transcript_10830/g.14577  ORF Transcript_10830/g.14577 Transcript_10830/m.14577 type:complete len:94 (-) Transcript_10830:78-359(-)
MLFDLFTFLSNDLLFIHGVQNFIELFVVSVIVARWQIPIYGRFCDVDVVLCANRHDSLPGIGDQNFGKITRQAILDLVRLANHVLRCKLIVRS